MGGWGKAKAEVHGHNHEPRRRAVMGSDTTQNRAVGGYREGVQVTGVSSLYKFSIGHRVRHKESHQRIPEQVLMFTVVVAEGHLI